MGHKGFRVAIHSELSRYLGKSGGEVWITLGLNSPEPPLSFTREPARVLRKHQSSRSLGFLGGL